MSVPARLQPLCRQPPAQLRHDSVHRGEVGERTRGQRPIELTQRPCWGQASGALDLGTLKLASQQRLESPQRRAPQAGTSALIPVIPRPMISFWICEVPSYRVVTRASRK